MTNFESLSKMTQLHVNQRMTVHCPCVGVEREKNRAHDMLLEMVAHTIEKLLIIITYIF